ncbi:MAG TPA: SusC/RagA family TonB-linked outer membrane protein, partial [Sediminibacterium sp.]|nr:SusC/RagA family TonB-linked outer membrane protein [Sediminibacterium sp.]
MRKMLLFLACCMSMLSMATAQTRNLSGKVTDATGNPVPFVNVTSQKSKVTVTANENGVFNIRSSAGDILTVTGIGVETQKVTVGSQGNTLNIVVKQTVTNLSEVVVTTALCIKRQPKELGYSTTKIGSAELTQAKVTNIATGLAAKVSGLQINLVNNSVKPDVRITLRGNRSILGNNQALLVVDDIQLPITYINSLSPDDIDNVTVLKGASASALYGSAASNGVIIITTKKGTRGKPVVKLSSTVNLESISYMPALQNRFGSYGGENDPNAYPGIVAIPTNPFTYYVPYENQNYGPEFNGQRIPIGAPIRIYNPDGTFVIKQDSGYYSAQPNAKRDFFNTGVTLINNVSYSAGDEKSRFFLSFEDANAKGVLPGDENRRNTIRINGSRESGIFRADYNVGYSLTHTNTTPGSGVPFTYGTSGIGGGYAGGGSYFQNRPVYWTVINTPANINLRDYRDWQNNPFANPNGYFNAYYGNPWWQIDNTRLDEHSNDLLANVLLTLKPLRWLNLQYRAGIARNDYNNKYTQNGFTFADWAIADTLGSGNIPSGVKKLSPSEGDAVSYNQRLTSDFLASVQRSFGNFNLHFIAGTSLIDNSLRLFSASANALVIPGFYNISNRVGEPNVSEYKQETRTLGVFGDLTIGYKDYLFLHGSLRNDWNSLLAASNRSYLYPAVDGSFVFTDAIPSLKDNNFLSFGKVRAAYSKTAQVSIGAYALENTFNSGTGFPFGNVAGYTVNGSYANPDIKPEFSTDYEVGADLGFLKNRINFSVAVYSTKTTNQTIPISISQSTGFSQAYVNSGEMTNKGIELDLKISPVVNTHSGFRWDIGANFSYNKNIVQSIGYGLSEVNVGGNSYAIVGQPYPVIKVNDWERDPLGRIIVDKNSGYHTLDPALKSFGTTVPPTKIGLSTTFSYKGFTLNALFDARFGAVIYNALGSSMDFTGVSAYSAQSGRQPFVIPNSVYDDGTGKYVPNTNILTKDGNIAFWANLWNTAGSNYVNSADFWKLRELSLTYQFSKKLLEHLKVVNGLSIGLVGRNLIMWKAKGNLWSDPEF